jgi:type IV pilus assembly protein PilM
MSDDQNPIWKKEISFPGASQGEPEPVDIRPLPVEPPAPPAVPSIADGAEDPYSSHSLPAPDETVEVQLPPVDPTPEPPLPPAAAAPIPVPVQTIHPPVPASELPELPGEKKLPFWKREISLGRSSTPKAERPAKVKAEKQPKAKAERKPKAEKKPRGEKTPKGEKKPKAEPKRAPGTVKTPIWKRELSLKKPVRKRATSEAGGSKNAKLVGLKVGASQIAAARVHNNGSPEVLQTARADLAHGIIVSGELRDPEALTVALKEFFRKNKLPTTGVRLGIANDRIGVRMFDVTGIADPRQLDNAVRFRAQEALPIPINEAVLDYHVLSERIDEDGNPVKRILLVVAYRELIDRYVNACKAAGIKLVGIDLEAFALLRVLAAPAESGEAALVAVSIGHDRSTFAVSDGRTCQFTRVLDWGGASLDTAIGKALDLPAAEASRVKHRLSLETGAILPEGLTQAQAAAALDAVRRQLQSFARELVSSLQFYQKQPESLGIGEIIVTGGTAHLPGIEAELERLIGVAVRIGAPLDRVRVSKRVAVDDQIGSLAVAIGLGIED